MYWKNSSIPRTEATVRQASTVVSGFVQDLMAAGKLPAGSEYLAADPKKQFRAREKVMGSVQQQAEQEMQESEITALMVDSR